LVGGTAEQRGGVLIADDDDELRSSLAELLSGAGYRVSQARDGEEALAAVTGPAPPDLVLLDVNMPRLDGLGVLRRMRELRANVGVLMMTAYGTPHRAVQSIELGAYQYITKPFGSDEVLAAVAGWYEARRRAADRAAGQLEAASRRPEDPVAVLGEAVALLLRREAARANGADGAELRDLLARLEQALGTPPGRGDG
jgi:DNA-binding response OmpR family regulator